MLEDAVQKTGQLVGKAYDGLKEVKSSFDGIAKNTAAKFVEKYGDDNFFGKFAEDIANYNKNNVDINKIKDANYFSAYKGKKVVKDKLLDGINNNILSVVNDAIDKKNIEKDKETKPSNIKIGSTFGIGDLIVIGENAGKDVNGDFNINEYEKDVKHEYGHTMQYDNMGPVKFIKDVAIPSMKGYNKSNKGEDIDYYAQPWERGADINGEVDRGEKYKGLQGIGTSQDDSSYYVKLKLKQFKQKILKFLDELN